MKGIEKKFSERIERICIADDSLVGEDPEQIYFVVKITEAHVELPKRMWNYGGFVRKHETGGFQARHFASNEWTPVCADRYAAIHLLVPTDSHGVWPE
jgi:hypothetical protein